MNIPELKNRKQISIGPGEHYVTKQNVVIHTLLGSCVSACLYDPIRNIMGMNHFLLSNDRYTQKIPACMTEAGRYGIHSMELLINEMLKLGAKRENLKAKAFGGASMWDNGRGDNYSCVGDVNSRFIKEFLHNERIPLVISALEGDRGRVIYFSFGDYSVYVRKIQKKIGSRVVKRERKFWKSSIKAQETQVIEPDIWE